MSKWNRLFAFGCSNTLGDGLPDTWDSQKQDYILRASDWAFPQLTADLLEIPCKNFGVSGASNRLIADRVLNTQFTSNNLVIIHWSYWTRSTIIKQITPGEYTDRNTYTPLANWCLQKHVQKDNPTTYKINLEYHKWIQNNTDSLISTLRDIQLCDYYLKSTQTQVIHAVSDQCITQDQTPDWFTVDLFPTDVCSVQGNLALDGQHPGTLKHKRFSELIYAYTQDPAVRI